MSEGDARPWPKVGMVRRFGPALLVVVALVAVGAVATTRSNSAPAAKVAGPAKPHDLAANPELPVTWQMAARAGTTSHYQWVAGCDHATGRLRIPSIYAPPCVPVDNRPNGGATTNGVTGSTITVVYYEAPPGDLASAIEGAAGTPATNLATVQHYVDMYNKIMPLYGRKVVLVPYNATGDSNDAVAARADALRVADQLHAFASISGPAQTPAYEDELARLHVLCLECGLGATYTDYQNDSPYLWGFLPTPDTLLNESFRYIFTQLQHHDAQWAGTPSFRHRTRSFALVTYNSSPPRYTSITAHIKAELAHAGLTPVVNEQYLLDLSELPSEAATIAEHLKQAQATTVIFVGDPIMPIYLTKACAALDYYPEWVITGTVFTDTSTLGRYYNQKEWAHAFGISSLAVPTPIQLGDAWHLYRWWYGTTPPAPGTASVILPGIEQLFDGIELAGPDLTAGTWAGGLFRYPPTGGGVTTPLEAYGYDGAPPVPSYTTPADYTFIWYDAAAKGTDEEGQAGTGMVRYVDGGKRFSSTTGPADTVPMFQVKGSVLQYPTYPPSGRPPSYPPWPGSPTALAAGG